MRICAAWVGSVFARRRATGERETGWRKRGVSLVSGMFAVSCDVFASSVWADRAATRRW